MNTDISKVCSDHLRSLAKLAPSWALKASHAREIVAAYFGYRSHAALLAEESFPVNELPLADVLIPDVKMIEARRKCLTDLPSALPNSLSLAASISAHLVQQGFFVGKVWIYESLENYVTEVLLPHEDAHILNELAGVMAETNAEFDYAEYETAEVFEDGDLIRIEVAGQYSGQSDEDRMFCGDQIDMSVTVELSRVAGRVAFSSLDISASGEVNDNWVDPDLKYGSSASEKSKSGSAKVKVDF